MDFTGRSGALERRIDQSHQHGHAATRLKRGFSTASTPRFSGGALIYVPWYFIHDRPLQPVVRRLPIHLNCRQSLR